MNAVMANVYRGGYLPLMGGTGQMMASCLALLAKISIFEVRRRWGYPEMGEQLDRLARHARATIQHLPVHRERGREFQPVAV